MNKTLLIQNAGPFCLPGTSLDTQICQCDNVTDPICPFGFTPAVDPQDQCICERISQPICPLGEKVNPDTCQCRVLAPFPCIEGSPNCVSTSDPLCPTASRLTDCQCESEAAPQCDSGELSSDGCQCISSFNPKCLNTCRLNPIICTCERVTSRKD